jgi:hypothetical protein
LIREFMRAYHHYANHLPDDRASIEWLSIMQHHGAPTRLLDFTYSIYVAAYFAVEAAGNNSESAVWAIDASWALNEFRRFLPTKARRRIGESPFMTSNEIAMSKVLLHKPFIPVPCTVNPFRLNERLRVQTGAFLAPGDITKPFWESLKALGGSAPTHKIKKLVVPADRRLEFLERLWSMNISRASLFPGLDGFAQSLGVYHPILKPVRWSSKHTALIDPSWHPPS